MNISKNDKDLITELIKEAESKSRCEIVPMIIHHSDHYPAAHFRAAILMSFFFSLGLYFSPFSIINPLYFLWIQIPGLFLGYYLAYFPFIKKMLITRLEIEEEVAQKGFEAFFHHNLHLTADHNGILILISIMERKIKIIADHGISSKVEALVWDEIILEFTTYIKKGQFVLGLQNCILATGKVLQASFPATENESRNKLANELIIEN